ncbi:MAG TPA: hypothetical protein VKO83_03250, partial [Steroidobacteraceae bacterium]|nr:hypothetical protein [Steroidobacteraceae bacterium]
MLRRRDNSVHQAQQERMQADEAVSATRTSLQKLQYSLQTLEREIAGKENRAARDEQIRRLQKLRANRRAFPAG